MLRDFMDRELTEYLVYMGYESNGGRKNWIGAVKIWAHDLNAANSMARRISEALFMTGMGPIFEVTETVFANLEPEDAEVETRHMGPDQ